MRRLDDSSLGITVAVQQLRFIFVSFCLIVLSLFDDAFLEGQMMHEKKVVLSCLMMLCLMAPCFTPFVSRQVIGLARALVVTDIEEIHQGRSISDRISIEKLNTMQ